MSRVVFFFVRPSSSLNPSFLQLSSLSPSVDLPASKEKPRELSSPLDPTPSSDEPLLSSERTTIRPDIFNESSPRSGCSAWFRSVNSSVPYLPTAPLNDLNFFSFLSSGIFVLLEILILYADFRYSYRDGLDNILVLLIGGIPIAMPTVLSVTMAVGAQQLAKHKAIVTRITAIEELAGVTILCSDKTGTLTTNKLTIDMEEVKRYGPFNAQEVMTL